MQCYLSGIGLLGPGLHNWQQAQAVFNKQSTYNCAAIQFPALNFIPKREARRLSRITKLALSVAMEAVNQSQFKPSNLSSIFASGTGDMDTFDELCTGLALQPPTISPTKFSHSLLNSVAGIWSIATDSQGRTLSLANSDELIVNALSEAIAYIHVDKQPVLMVVYDVSANFTMQPCIEIPHSFASAFVLTPEICHNSIAKLEFDYVDGKTQNKEATDDLTNEFLALYQHVPAAAVLPLLSQLAQKKDGQIELPSQGQQTLIVTVSNLACV